jgi:hypothetical protein
MSNDLLALLARAHPNASQGDLLAMIAATPDRAPRKPVQARCGSRPRTPASLERRRSWAAAGRLPPALAAKFTLAEQAALALIAEECRKRGACGLTLGQIAAQAGVGRTTVQNALRVAKRLGILHVEESRKTPWVSNPHRITITDPGWLAWLRIGRAAHGFKSLSPTHTGSSSEVLRRRNRREEAAEGRVRARAAPRLDSRDTHDRPGHAR